MKTFFIIGVAPAAGFIRAAAAWAAQEGVDPAGAMRGLAGLAFLAVLALVLLKALFDLKKKRAALKAGEAWVAAGMGGWLLFFAATTAFRVIQEIFTVVVPMALILVQAPSGMAQAASSMALLILCYDLAWIYGLWRICAAKPGAPSYVKKLLVAAPLLYAALPLLTLLSVRLFTGVDALTGQAALESYSFEVLTELAAVCLHSVLWYAYFCRSRRVRNTWPPSKPKN